ncbi:hypothetical protein H5T09_15480 [Escherichia coli]|nr:hypothetical protein [Escherichia coli]MBZ8730784.1 hypothetical protein [Escherichia coli]MBZ8736528.1 hypothetical protein [Escherichia coli]MBZ8741293.1 hypothetical protein [Escherichia coli]MBZ8746426.1 hypothetical protein [Escherichia coli]
MTSDAKQLHDVNRPPAGETLTPPGNMQTRTIKPRHHPADVSVRRTATSGGITTTPVAVQAVPDGHHIGSVCLHDAPSHYTSARNTTSQHHSTTAPQHQLGSVCHPAQAQPPAEG